MTDNNWKYTAYMKLYGKGGLQVNFTVNGEDEDVFAAEIGDFLTRMLDAEGYSITPEGIKPGEKIQEVDGWVYGETSTGEPCIHLYKTPLQWKVATIYKESIQSVPIAINSKTFQWPGTAPEKDVAERKGAINPCNFTIILVPTGKTSDKGNPIFKFDRVIGFSPAGGKPAASSNNSSKGKAENVQSYADLYDMLKDEPKKLADWCRSKQEAALKIGDTVATNERLSILCEEIDNITGDESTGEIVLEVLTGVPATDIHRAVKTYVVNGLIKWIAPYILSGKNTVENPDRKMPIVEAVKFIWGMANGYNEVNSKATEAASSTPLGDSYNDEDIPF